MSRERTSRYDRQMRFAPLAEFRGTSLERILRVTGIGTLLVNDPGRLPGAVERRR